jgi:hypothetical protein
MKLSQEIFYTYLWLREDGTPYYVGKGKDRRAIRKGSPKDLDCILIQEFPSEQDAFAAEVFLIDYYGRKDLGTGCLRNRTSGGEGVRNPSEQCRQRYREAGRIGGRIGGRKNVESGHIMRLGRKSVESGQLARIGRLGGRKNVETGHMARLNRWNQENKVGIFAPGYDKSTGGRKNVESGHMGRLCRKNAESGHMARISVLGTHTQWHLNRGIANPECPLCQAVLVSTAVTPEYGMLT